MGRAVTALLVGLSLAATAEAKFGISKTRVPLPRVRPAEEPPLAETLHVDVRSEAPEVTGAHLGLVRGRLEEALEADGTYALVDHPRDADAVVRVALSGLQAEIRDEVRYERKRVKVGEKQVWDEKKQKYRTEDVWADRQVPVSWRIAQGHVAATIEIGPPAGEAETEDASTSYDQEFEQDEGSPRLPPEATSEESLRRFLVGGVAEETVARVCNRPDPVEALLAVNGELKTGNKLAEAGRFEDALREWTRKTFRGDTEAARLHNVGVAHEALAYGLALHHPEHRAALERARGFYEQALRLDPDEKYFRDPLIRIEASLSHAESAARFAAELARFKEEGLRRADAARPAPMDADGPVAVRASVTTAGPPGLPLRNGSFESSLAPWKLGGRGSVVEETGRGRVLEVAAATAESSVGQEIGVDLGPDREASLSLDYRVTAGEGLVRVQIAYADESGKERKASLPVTAGEGPGGWSSWTGEVWSLRPRPSRVKEVRIVVEGGTVRLDNVALTSR